MTDPGASADGQQKAWAVMPVTGGQISLAGVSRLPLQAETPDPNAAGLPLQGPGESAALQTPIPESAHSLKTAWSNTPGAHRLGIMPAFQAAVDMDRLIQRQILPLNAYTRWVRDISRMTIPTYTSAVLSLPRLNVVERIVPAIPVDLGFHQVFKKITTSLDLGLFQHNQRLAKLSF
jgi:hypothetical protein